MNDTLDHYRERLERLQAIQDRQAAEIQRLNDEIQKLKEATHGMD